MGKSPPHIDKYFLRYEDEEEKEVTLQEWVSAERGAGFRPKGRDDGQPATAGFTSSGWGRSVRGRIQRTYEP